MFFWPRRPLTHTTTHPWRAIVDGQQRIIGSGAVWIEDAAVLGDKQFAIRVARRHGLEGPSARCFQNLAELSLKIFLPFRAGKVDDVAAIEYVEPVFRQPALQ